MRDDVDGMFGGLRLVVVDPGTGIFGPPGERVVVIKPGTEFAKFPGVFVVTDKTAFQTDGALYVTKTTYTKLIAACDEAKPAAGQLRQ